MNKTAKGAFAATAASVLLLGGAGSLAFWTDTEVLKADSITAGNLSLDPHSCEDWKYAADKAGAGAAASRFVPGDVVSKTCTFVVKASGDNLEAELKTPATYAVTGTNVKATVVAEYKVGTVTHIGNVTQIGSADNNKKVTATFTVTFPYGTDENAVAKENINNMQNSVATLNDITVTLTQSNPN